jgi:hypothetical protein
MTVFFTSQKRLQMAAETVRIGKIVGRGTKVTGAGRGVGNAVNNDAQTAVYPPMQGGKTLTVMGGTASIAIAEELVEGVDFKYRVLEGTDNWEVEFLTGEQTVAYNNND